MPVESGGTAVAATRAALARIEQENPSLNAIAETRPELSLAAAAAVDGVAAAGAPKGPLHGLPIVVKDIIDVAGYRTRAGSHTRRDVAPAAADAPVVARLKAAGCVVVGKANTTEYALGGWGTNASTGTPRNPWDHKVHRTPGGSSNGSGVAVGAGLVPAGLGTDTGGSVRIPAAQCGCVGLKTSIGLVSRTTVVALSETLDTVGPLTDTVRRAAEILAAMQGPDAADASTRDFRLVDPLRDIDRGISGLRLGRVADEDMPLAVPEVRTAFTAAVRKLEEAGASIVPFRLPFDLEELLQRTGTISGVEGFVANRSHMEDEKAPLQPIVRHRLAAGRTMTAADFQALLASRRRLIADMLAVMDRVDALILPTTPMPAVPLTEVDELKSPFSTHTRFVNYLELCAIAVPMSLTGTGLPTSLQIVGRRFEDPLVLRIGQAFEKVRGPFPRPR